MATPSTAITRFDLSLTYAEFNLLANLKKFIGLRVLPPLAVLQEGGEFVRVVVASLLNKVENTARNADGTYKLGDFEWGKDSYALTEYGVEEKVDDATIERYGDIIRVERIAVMRSINRVLTHLEVDIANAVMSTATFAGADLTTDISVPFTTKASADPLAVFDAAHDKVKANCGEKANTIVMTDKGFRNMVRTDRLESLLKYDASELLIALNTGANQSMVSQIASGLKELLQVEQILVGRGAVNTADDGQTPVIANGWNDDRAMLCVVHDDGLSGDLESPAPQLGRTLFSTKNGEPLPGTDDAGAGSLIIEEYRMEQFRGGRVRPRNKRQVKILHKEAGHLLTGIMS